MCSLALPSDMTREGASPTLAQNEAGGGAKFGSFNPSRACCSPPFAASDKVSVSSRPSSLFPPPKGKRRGLLKKGKKKKKGKEGDVKE